ncbi:hypothetical protein CsSME_00054211 [Camellia sinensis var. sinensis]
MVLMREIKDDRGGFGQRRSWWKQTTTNMCLTSSPLATEPLTYYRQSSDLWWCLRWKEKEEEGFCNGEWICRFVNSFSEPFFESPPLMAFDLREGDLFVIVAFFTVAARVLLKIVVSVEIHVPPLGSVLYSLSVTPSSNVENFFSYSFPLFSLFLLTVFSDLDRL